MLVIPGIDQEGLAAVCARWAVLRLEVFGSAARGQLRPDSDLDLLVTFDPAASWNAFDLMDMQDELERVVGRKVDLLTRRAVERSRNAYRREQILGSAEVIVGP